MKIRNYYDVKVLEYAFNMAMKDLLKYIRKELKNKTIKLKNFKDLYIRIARIELSGGYDD